MHTDQREAIAMSNGFTWYGVDGEEFIESCVNHALKESLEKNLQRFLPTDLQKEDIPALERTKDCLSQSLSKDRDITSIDNLIEHLRQHGTSYIERSW
jgi:hypothetical protein